MIKKNTILSLLLCAGAFVSAVHAQMLLEGKGEKVVYQESYPDQASYVSRILVTKDYLRMDYGEDDNDFVLLDRQKKQVYNIVHDNETILRIRYQSVTEKPPVPLEFSVHPVPQSGDHQFMGRSVSQHRYLSKASVCRNTVSVDGVMTESLVALREFYTVLAGQQAKGLKNTPKEMLSACDMAINTFHPLAFLQHGLPLRLWDGSGLVRELVDLDPSATIPDALFDLPKGYRMIELSSMTGE